MGVWRCFASTYGRAPFEFQSMINRSFNDRPILGRHPGRLRPASCLRPTMCVDVTGCRWLTFQEAHNNLLDSRIAMKIFVTAMEFGANSSLGKRSPARGTVNSTRLLARHQNRVGIDARPTLYKSGKIRDGVVRVSYCTPCGLCTANADLRLELIAKM